MSDTNTHDIELPVKRVTGDTLEERLTENAYQNILPSRYLRRDEDGDLIEEPEDLFDRVAKNIALPEAVYEAENRDIDVKVTPDQVKENHSNRDELIKEIFGSYASPGDDVSVPLTEENAKHFSYDSVVPKLDDEDLREHVENTKHEFEKQMTNLSFMPNSPTLMNAGAELQQLSACFVNSPIDDITDIHEKVSEAAQVFKSGGGMGYAFHHLRPYGDQVGSTGGIASGPISFMRTFDQMCQTIAQGGKRRGAQMGVMRVSHPDIVHFVHSKNKDVSLKETLLLNDPNDTENDNFEDALEEARGLINEDGAIPKHLRNAAEGHLSNFNISVGITDDFMDAVKNDEEYTFTNPRTNEPHIATEETKKMYGWYDLDEHVEVGEELSIPANLLWERILEGAHENGEPGVIFIDRVNEDHSFPVESLVSNNSDDPMSEYVVHATNPCGEQPLMEGESCNLGHINLSTIVAEDAPMWIDYDTDSDSIEEAVSEFLDEAIYWDDLDERIETSTHFLENVITMSDFPIEKIEKTVSENRKIGLGIMGLAQMFIQLGVGYGSEAGNEVARQMMKYINHGSKDKSHELAKERGVFDNWEDSKYANPTEHVDWFERQTGRDAADYEDGFEMRNHNTTSIAPTGTTSMIGNTSGGCEPIFDVVYFKNAAKDVRGDDLMVEFDDYFRRTLEENGIDADAVKDEAAEQMANNEYRGIEGLSNVPDTLADVFVTSNQLTSIQHASVQTALQEGVDSAISKTVNAPADATIEDTKDTFEYVYDHGGKGVTYYRNGTRMKQVNTTRAQNSEFADETEAASAIAEQITDNFDSVVDFLTHEDAREIFETKLFEAARALVVEQEGVDANDEEAIADLLANFDINSNIELNGDDNGYIHPRDRPNALQGTSQRIDTGYGKVYITINEDENGQPFEIFANIGSSGGFTNSFTEALAKVVSVALRSGVDPKEVYTELTDIRSPKINWDRGEEINSIPDAIGTALRRHINDEIDTPYPEQSTIEEAAKEATGNHHDLDNDGAVETDPNREDTENDNELSQDKIEEDQAQIIQNGEVPTCPSCGKTSLYLSEGCKTCQSCGWSEC